MYQEFGCEACMNADKQLEGFIDGPPLEASHDGVDSRTTKCAFGLQGVCCKLCTNGPCHITPDSPMGICGADAKVIVGRIFLKAVTVGSGCYIHLLEKTARNLKNTAQAGGELKGNAALDRLGEIFGIEEHDDHKLAIHVADAVIEDIYRPDFEHMALIQKLAYAPRYRKWEELGIIPGGAKSEVFDGMVKSSTKLNSDPTYMLLHCLRLGISTGIYGLFLTNLLNEVMLGDPVNLLPNDGDSNTLTGVSEVSLKKFLGGSFTTMIELIVSGKIKGVAGVIGCSNLTAGGHDVITAALIKDLISRDIIVLATGCNSGGIEIYSLMTTEAAELAGPNLKEACKSLDMPPVLNFSPCLAIGLLETAVTELAEALKIDTPQLPLVFSIAQLLEEQALADGAFGLALGLPLHLGLPPFATGSPMAINILTDRMKDLTGGQVVISHDVKETANILELIILEKRAALGLLNPKS